MAPLVQVNTYIKKQYSNYKNLYTPDKILIIVFLCVLVSLASYYGFPHFLTPLKIFFINRVYSIQSETFSIHFLTAFVQLLFLLVTSFTLYKLSQSVKTLHSFIITTVHGVFFIILGILLNTFDISLDIFIIPLSLYLFWGLGLIYKQYWNKTEELNIKKAFSPYVSPQVLDKITADPESIQLGGDIRKISVLFTDIRNFTAISEKMTGKQLVSLLNEYFECVSSTIFKFGGTVDKYVGDSVMAYWNAPVIDDQHAYKSCITALDMQEQVKRFNENVSTRMLPKLEMGIGINTGKMIVGNVGSKERFDYTVMGDEVNVSSRLEGLTKKYQVPIILGQNTLIALRDQNVLEKFSIRQLDIVKVKGKDKAIRIYELMGENDSQLENIKQRYEYAFSLYYHQKFDEASQEFVSIVNEMNDHPSKMMLIRCYNNIENPPNGDWSPAWDWDSK